MKIRNILLIFISLWFLLYFFSNPAISCMEVDFLGVTDSPPSALRNFLLNTKLTANNKSMVIFLNRLEVVHRDMVGPQPPIGHNYLVWQVLDVSREHPNISAEQLERSVSQGDGWYWQARHTTSSVFLRTQIEETFFRASKLNSLS